MNSVEVRDNPSAERYELVVDGTLAGVAEYHDTLGRRIFRHTEVDRAYSGRGLGNRLAAAALDDAFDHGLRVVPRCPFIRAFLDRHPDYRARLAAVPPDAAPPNH